MKAIYFMVIDYIKVKQQLYFLPLFIVIAFALGFSNLAAQSYLMFIAIIFATAPFGSCKRGDAGFLVLLPSTVTHRVLGRFLYGISYIGAMAVAGVIITGIFQSMGQKMEPWMAAAELLLLAFSLLVIAVEFLILYLVGEHLAPQLLGVVRTLPAMGAFFSMMYLMGENDEGVRAASVLQDLEDDLVQMGYIAVGAAILVWVIAIVICVRVTAKRDYV